VGQPPLSQLAAGKSRPLILVDDLTRPTPVDRVIPELLEQFAQAGIEAGQVTILMGGGTHRPATPEQMRRKLGSSVRGCRLLAHDSRRGGVRIGRTSQGTPVIVNRALAAADLVVGVGGVYPQHSVGFGGGSKLILGALAQRSIVALHYGHPSVAGTHDIDNDFRRDLDEIAELARLNTVVSLHVDRDREVVRAVVGDPRIFFRDAAAFSLSAYSAPLPAGADVVLVNAYPMDVSLTFTRSKGMAPLYQASPRASRILLSACSEGLGYHGLFPFLNGPRWEKQRHQLRRLSVSSPPALAAGLGRRVRRLLATVPPTRAAAAPPARPAAPHRPIHLLTAGTGPDDLPAEIPGLKRAASWEAVLRSVEAEQGSGRSLRVVVYTCSALQCLEFTGSEHTSYLTAGVAG